MKLKQLYNEIKLVPSNRILLRRAEEEDFYFFEIPDSRETLGVHPEELRINKIEFSEFYTNLNNLSKFLDSKNIKYERIYYNNGIGVLEDIEIIRINAKYFIVPDKVNEHQEKRYLINYQYYNKLLDISNQYKTKYIKKVLDSIHNNQNDMATQRQYDLLKKFADGYGDNDKYPYSTKN